MNVIEAQVTQVQRNDDGSFSIPPIIVAARHLDLYNTVLYDLLELGANLDDLRAPFRLAAKYTDAHVRRWVKCHGRVVIDEWISYPHAYRSHVELV